MLNVPDLPALVDFLNVSLNHSDAILVFIELKTESPPTALAASFNNFGLLGFINVLIAPVTFKSSPPLTAATRLLIPKVPFNFSNTSIPSLNLVLAIGICLAAALYKAFCSFVKSSPVRRISLFISLSSSLSSILFKNLSFTLATFDDPYRESHVSFIFFLAR